MLLVLAIAGLFVLPDPWRIIVLVLAAVVEVGELYLWTRFLRRYRVQSGPEALIGMRAEAIEPLSPRGRVRLRGEIWNARSAEPIEAGESVTVEAVDGLWLRVARGGP